MRAIWLLTRPCPRVLREVQVVLAAAGLGTCKGVGTMEGRRIYKCGVEAARVSARNKLAPAAAILSEH